MKNFWNLLLTREWGNSGTDIPSGVDDDVDPMVRESEKANGMKRVRVRMYTEAHTRPMLSGLDRTNHDQESSNTSLRVRNTYMGVEYTFNKSLPLR